MNVVYISHPIGGDVRANLKKVADISREINLNEVGVVPFAPYYLDCVALDDNVLDQRNRGLRNNLALFHRQGLIDELRLYGNRISTGMKLEIDWAHILEIPVVPMTERTKIFYKSIYG